MDTNLILLALRRYDKCNNGLISAAFEFFTSRLQERKHDNHHQSDIFILTIDRPCAAYEPFCQRFSISSENVIDGFSEWHQLKFVHQKSIDNKTHKSLIHIGDEFNDNKNRNSDDTIRKILEKPLRSQSQNKYIIFDSLTSIKQLTSPLNFVRSIQRVLYEESVKNPGTRITFFTALRTAEHEGTLMRSIHRVFDTVIRVYPDGHRTESSKTKNKLQNVRFEVENRKLSGRVHFETINGCYSCDNSQIQTIQVTKDESELNSKDADPSPESELISKLDQHGLSFRLSLSSKEREVRAKVGLSYQHQNEKVADTALELHPASLQIEEGKTSVNASELLSSDDDDSEEEELFSEDV